MVVPREPHQKVIRALLEAVAAMGGEFHQHALAEHQGRLGVHLEHGLVRPQHQDIAPGLELHVGMGEDVTPGHQHIPMTLVEPHTMAGHAILDELILDQLGGGLIERPDPVQVGLYPSERGLHQGHGLEYHKTPGLSRDEGNIPDIWL